MSALLNTAPDQRQIRPTLCPVNGHAVFCAKLTPAERTDEVHLIVDTVYSLPVVFVPGIMGSNLRTKQSATQPAVPVWRMDSKAGILRRMKDKSAGIRQNLLHPARTEVDPDGAVPNYTVGTLASAQAYRARGWGEVSAGSYHSFLLWLEQNLNHSFINAHTPDQLQQTLQQVTDPSTWGAQKDFLALTQTEVTHNARWAYPVYAAGYNWLADNAEAAQTLATRIKDIIAANNRSIGVCEKVILITHSMGGLVARACSQMDGMDALIAGVVHGVMPTTGAAVAYRRCKVGLMDEGASGVSLDAALAWGGAKVIGQTGQEVTAVFAQSPGALALLPTSQYPADWLQVRDSDGSLLPEQPSTVDPYRSIYSERNKWWGLIKEEWLSPKDGKPIDWKTYKKALTLAKDFHEKVTDHYHPNTWGFYGRGIDSFERVTWRLEAGDAPRDRDTPDPKHLMNLHRNAVRMDGTNPEEIPGPDREQELEPGLPGVILTSSYYRLRLDRASATLSGTGDGTVPVASGRAPVQLDAVRQLFALPGVEHEPAYQDSKVRQVTAYAVAKIAAQTRLPDRVGALPRPKA